MKLSKIIGKILLTPYISYAKKGNVEDFFDYICNELEDENLYPSFRIRRKDSRMTPINTDFCKSDNIAIVLQGPIRYKDDFTLNSIRFYKELYCDAKIILSTWKDEPESLLDDFKRENIFIVKNDKPIFSGNLNVNYQIVSSRAGIKKAKELDAKYVVKTRTDQRVCRPYIFNTMEGMLDFFPIETECNINKRVIVIPTNHDNMFTPYFMSDFFYFGTTEDLYNLFNVKLSNKSNEDFRDLISRRDYSKSMFPPEIYLLKNFIKDYTNESCEDTVFEYWECLKKYFVCMDINMLDLFLVKYSYSHKDYCCNGDYFQDDNINQKKTQRIGFSEWFNLYNGSMKYLKEYESQADENFF